MATYAGSSKEEFSDVYYERQGNWLKPVQVFYPEYYRSIAVRLYNFNGAKVTPRSCTVISYEEKVNVEGVRYKEIVSSQSFSSYGEAAGHILKQTSGKHKIVGTNPFISPVPLDVLNHYKLVYRSDTCLLEPGIGFISEVKIFEYAR